MRRLTVYWQQTPDTKLRVGELAQGSSPEIAFEWDKEFLLNSIELSPITFVKQPGVLVCPSEPFNGLPGLFYDHLPDGWGNVLLRHGLAREGIATEQLSPLDKLAYIGNDAMGALSFEPALRTSESWAKGAIDLSVLQSETEPIITGSPSEALGQFLSGGVSPSGARPKIIAKEIGKELYIADRTSPAPEWIIKFRADVDGPYKGKLEYLYYLMAKDAGLTLPEAKLFKAKRQYFFGAKRFDREADGSRLHMQTLSTLLNASPTSFSVSYDLFATVTQRLTEDVRQVQAAYRICAFNILSCNQDDHTKNVAFLMDSDGRWELAPAYDLTFSRTPYGEHKMDVDGNGKPSAEDLKEFGAKLGLTKTTVKRILDQVSHGVSRYKYHARKLEIPKREITKIADVIDPKLKVRRARAR